MLLRCTVFSLLNLRLCLDLTLSKSCFQNMPYLIKNNQSPDCQEYTQVNLFGMKDGNNLKNAFIYIHIYIYPYSWKLYIYSIQYIHKGHTKHSPVRINIKLNLSQFGNILTLHVGTLLYSMCISQQGNCFCNPASKRTYHLM